MTQENAISYDPGRRAAADALESNLDKIFSIYERKLVEEQNFLVSEVGGDRELLREQAFSLLGRAAKALREGSGEALALEEEIQRNAGAAEAPATRQPDESFRAGVALCAAALEVVLSKVDLSGESPESVVGLSLEIQKSIMDYVARVAMTSYVDYMLVKIGEMQAEERRRLSRDLHDHIAHSMALVKQSLELYSATRHEDEAVAEAKLERAREAADKAIEMSRNMAMEMRHSEAEDTLRVAFDNLIRANVPPDIEVEVEVSGDEETVPNQVRDQVYMALREGLRNAVSHSGGKRVRIEVEISATELVASVEDWGVGFDVSDPEGVGLNSMRERVEMMHGSLTVASTPGKGTRAQVRVPLRKKRRSG